MRKEFKSDKQQIFKMWLWATMVAWIIGIMGFYLLTLLIGIRKGDYSFNVTLSLVISAIAGLIYTWLFSIVTIVVDSEKIQFIRRGNVYKEFDFKSYRFGSYILKQRSNLMPIAITTRYLNVLDLQTKKQKNYNCSFFSKETFEQFITYVSNVSKPKTTNNMENVADIKVEQSQKYIFQKEEFLNESKKSYIKNSVLVLIIPIVFIIMMFATNRDEEFIGILTVFSVIIMLICLGVCLYFKIKRDELKDKIPNEIKVDGNSIVIDGKVFNVLQIERISLTPPKYLMIKLNPIKKMIMKYDGKVYTYFFGYPIKGKEFFSEYEYFYNNVEKIFEKYEGKWTKNLEG